MGLGGLTSFVRRYSMSVLALVLVLGWAAAALAQDTTQPQGSTNPLELLRQMELLALPFLTSLLLQGIKLFVSFIPDKALPFIAPLGAVVINAISQSGFGIDLAPGAGGALQAAAFGGTGAVYLHQAVRQIKKPGDDPQQADRRG